MDWEAVITTAGSALAVLLGLWLGFKLHYPLLRLWWWARDCLRKATNRDDAVR